MELRPTTEGDLPELHATFAAATDELFRRHAFDPPAPSQAAFTAIQRHLLRTGTSVVAVDGHGSVRGFAAAFTRGSDWFLASLFVRPAAQARGLGSALLDAVWGEAPRRRTITDAIQPVSNALYARRGLVPATPLLTFDGVPSPSTERATEGGADLVAIDTAAYGFDRAVDHAYWSGIATRTEWGDAYSYTFPGGAIGPVAGLTPGAAARALAAELARSDGDVRVRIPGSARPLVDVALRAGLRLSPVPGLLLLSERLEPPTALAPSGYALY